MQNESYANLTIVVLDANDNAPTWYNYDRLRRKHSSMESEGVSMDDEKENINSVIPTYTVKGSVNSRIDNSVNFFGDIYTLYQIYLSLINIQCNHLYSIRRPSSLF